MKSVAIRVLIALLLVVSLFGTARSQGNQIRGDRLRQELERTDQLIDRARDAVQATDNPLAAQSLNRAIELQQKAHDAFNDDHPLICWGFTKEAREQATRALANARITDQVDGAVLRKLERGDELLERVRENMADNQEHNLSGMFESAQNNLLRAWEFYRNGQYRPAAKLTDQVTKAAQRMLIIFRNDDQDRSIFDRRAETVDRMLDYAREVVSDCDSPSGSQYLEQAEQSRATAADLAQRNQPGAALKALLRARQAAQQASSECRRWSNLEQRYERLKAEADQLAEKLRDSDTPDESAQLLLEQTYAQLDLAHKGLQDQELQKTQAALQAAHLSLRQAQQHLKSGN